MIQASYLPSVRVHVDDTLWYLCHWCPCPQDELQPPATSQEDLPRPACRSGPGSYEVTAFALGPGTHETLCVSSKSGLSFPQFCWALAIKPHWPSKLNTLGALPPDARPLGWRDWLPSSEWGSELSLMWENFCNLIVLQFVENPGGMGFDYTASVALLPSCCGFFFVSLDIGDLFWYTPVFCINDYSALVVILVWSWEEVSSGSFYSSILSFPVSIVLFYILTTYKSNDSLFFLVLIGLSQF